jgi:hypothetical protein
MTTETWAKIPSFSKYEVSTLGNVRGLRGQLNPAISNAGYERVGLYHDDRGKRSLRSVHRLVAETFLDDWDPKKTVDHVDRDKRNNRVENLRMATSAEQYANRDSSRTSRGLKRRVDQVSLEDRSVVAIHESLMAAAASVGGHYANVAKCIAGKYKYAYGYLWRYHVAESDADLPGETWKQFRDTNAYVSNMGRFKKSRARGWTTVKSAADFHISNGYPIIGIDNRHVSCHRAVAELFLDPPRDQAATLVNHKNGNRFDAAAENLEWITPSDNIKHAHDTGLLQNRVRVIQKTRDGHVVAEFESMSEAARQTGILQSAISRCVSEPRRTAGGFSFIASTACDTSNIE